MKVSLMFLFCSIGVKPLFEMQIVEIQVALPRE
jgi:hypothetical protein